MNELFGIPLDTFLAILGVALGVAFGILAVLVLRNPVLVRLGFATSAAGAGTGLIVLGLMLGTTIVAAALVTGDTMSHTIRTTAVAALGESDEIVSARGAVDDIPGELGWRAGSAGSRRASSAASSRPSARPDGRRRRGRRQRRPPGAADAADGPASRSAAEPHGSEGFAPITRARTATRSRSPRWSPARSTSTPTPPTS